METNETALGLSPSVYGAEGAMLQLADKFFEPGEYTSLKSGFLGYMIGSMARISSGGAYHRDLLWREGFLNTASLPRSIYEYAKTYEYTVGLARPARCRALIGILMSDLRRIIGADDGVMTVAPGLQVLLGSTQFIVIGGLKISLIDGNKIVAAYDEDEMTFPLTARVPYIRTYVIKQADMQEYLYLEVELAQAVLRERTFKSVSTNVAEVSYFTVAMPESEYLCEFTVEYKAPGSSAWVDLPAYFNEASQPTDPKYCFYTFSGDGELRVFFSVVPGAFRPAFNSALRVKYLTTVGSGGNRPFVGTPVTRLDIGGRPVPLLAELVTQPGDGADMETLLDVKRGILRKILSRSNIVIERDLQEYLGEAMRGISMNGSKVSFIKRRDDILHRRFNAFLLARDSSGNVVPTNTAPLSLEIAELEDRGWSLKPGTLVTYDLVNRTYRLIGPGEYPDKTVTDPASFLYCVPYLMAFRTAPFPRLVYFNNSVNEDVILETSPGTVETSDSFLASTLSVRRMPLVDDSYQLEVAVSSGIGTDALASKCHMIMHLLTTDGVSIGYATLANVAGTNIFRAILETRDDFNSTGDLLLRDCIWRMGASAPMRTTAIPENMIARIGLYYDTDGGGVETGVDAVDLPETVRRGADTLYLVRQFAIEASHPLRLYESLESVMYGDLAVTTEGVFRCESTPLIGAAYFLSPSRASEVMNLARAYHTALKDAFEFLQNNTSIDIKYYRTYGPSETYSTTRVNLSISLDVRPYGAPSQELRDKITSMTSDFVASCNETSTGRFSISNLLTLLETKIPEIESIRFTGLNGSMTQSADVIVSDRWRKQSVRRVPEFISVSLLVGNALNPADTRPDVSIRFI